MQNYVKSNYYLSKKYRSTLLRCFQGAPLKLNFSIGGIFKVNNPQNLTLFSSGQPDKHS
jgi:hypothetical protein